MLYSIQHKDSRLVSYLFGTLHLCDKRAYTYFEVAIEKMKLCHAFYAETDLSKMDAEKVSESFTLPESLDLIIGTKKYEKCRKALLESFGMDLNFCKHFKPMYIQTLYTNLVITKDYNTSLDQALYLKALEYNMRTDGLESPEEQYEIAKALDLNTQIKIFLKMCRNTPKFRQEIHSMCNLYAQNELSKIYKKGLKSLGNLKHIILFDRNIKMANKIASNFHNGASFYCCGAAHLAGNGGIIALLKKSGFMVKTLV
ncbi:MAG: hypothetical protein RLZZ546_1831 [Bacteroidota bacterium]|jgi:uncharacterized protein YbaP (TraB family)